MSADINKEIKHDDFSDPSECEIKNPFQSFTLASYLRDEFTQGSKFTQAQDNEKYHARRKRVYAFLTIPYRLELFMSYGLLQMLDHFLLVFTFLPVRCCIALLLLIYNVTRRLFRLTSSPLLSASQRCDLLKCLLLIICVICLNHIDISIIYHQIRGQSVIKIYIFFNMLEIADRLLSAASQDALDSLSSIAAGSKKSPKEHFGLFALFLVSQGFLLLHCVLMLFQVTTLNVAFNSHNKSLMTIMLSNNFVELKGSVFKKFAKNNLFQMSCADVRERFHYAVMLAIVVFRNMSATGWIMEDFVTILVDCSLVMIVEMLVDWIKHAFITKFNAISADVYKEFTVSIAYDLLLSRQPKNYWDHFDLMSRRMGLTPLPLSCLVIMILLQSVPFDLIYGYVPLVILGLFLLKIISNLILLRWAYSSVDAYQHTYTTGPTPQGSPGKAHDDLILPPRTHRRSRSDSSFTKTFLTNGMAIEEVPDRGALEVRTSPVACQGDLTSHPTGGQDLGNSPQRGRGSERSRSVDIHVETKSFHSANTLESIQSSAPIETEVRRRQRTRSGTTSESESVKQPLPDVDRYSMVSSQIV